jgi:hypothetical protein
MAQDFPIKRLICDPFDNRVRERQLKREILTHKQLAQHIKTLPDSAENSEEFTVYLGEGPEDEAEAQA